MNKKYKIILVVAGVLILLSTIIIIGIFVLGNKSPRQDGAVRITNCWPASCQNPVFSPDNKYVMFTRFAKGYNKGPAKLVKVNLENKKLSPFAKAMGDEQVIVDLEGDNVNVPFGSWIGNKIVFSYEDGLAVANDDGSDLEKIASPLVADRNDSQKEQYIEPVFNPANTKKIVFEIVKGEKHQIGLISNGVIIELTDGNFDDRLPSWSPNGKKILWQRSEYAKDNWQIMTADIVLDENPHLENVTTLTQGPSDTDNSWTWNGKWILSSRTGDGQIPNIFALSTDGKTIKKITQSNYEDSAPSGAPDDNWIAFESHRTKSSNSPTDIWIKKAPLINNVNNTLNKFDWSNIKTYANSYIDYTKEDLEKLKKFDIVMIEPYNLPKEWVRELKNAGTIVVAYVSVGEADNDRRYWQTWQPSERAYAIDSIPRTVVDEKDTMFIGEDPGWPGSYFVDASNTQWQKILLDEENPYIMALGDNLYDGIVMDLIDVVDEYEGQPREQEMRQGMIDLIRKIKEKYPDKLVIPNRGFGILEEMGSYIDGFKFEELTLKYNNIPGQANFEKYDDQLDILGQHQNQEQIDQAVAFAKKYSRPIFVLDHAETEPMNTKSAQHGWDQAQKLSQKYGVQLLWYANSIDQDLPVWNFIKYSK